MNTNTQNTRTFVDIDLSFIKNPHTGDISIRRGENAIKGAVRNLIMTKHYERLFHSEVGSSVNGLLFENPSPGVAAILRQEVTDVIQNFEPRAEILSVDVDFSPDRHSVDISIVFRIINTIEPIRLEFTLKRVR